MTAFFTVAGKLVALFIYIVVGYVIVKLGVITKEFAAGISKFVMSITLPCLILKTFQTDYSTQLLAAAGKTYLFSIIAYAVSILIGYLTARLFHIEKKAKGVWVYSATFPNQAFMGWPVMAATLGSESLFFATFANLAFATYAYTYGVWLMKTTAIPEESSRASADSIKESSPAAGRGTAGRPGLMQKYPFLKDLLTTINGAILIGLFLFFTQLRIPAAVNNAITGMADLTTPLAMIFVGTILARNPLLAVLKDRRVYLMSLLRLIVILGLVLTALRPLGLMPLSFGAIVLSHAMPVAGFAAIYAGAYGNDVEFASSLVSVSSLLSVITIPVFVLLL